LIILSRLNNFREEKYNNIFEIKKMTKKLEIEENKTYFIINLIKILYY